MHIIKCLLFLLLLTLYHCNGTLSRTPFNVINPVHMITAEHINVEPIDAEVVHLAKILPNIFFNAYKNITVYFSDANDSCASDLVKLGGDSWNKEIYAVTLLDSWGKFESGILSGNLKWLGSYSECVQSQMETIQGHYCIVSMGSQEQKNAFIPSNMSNPVLKLGGCFPDSCSSSNISSVLTMINQNLTTDCPVQFNDWKTKDTVAIVVCSLLICLALSSTAYDYMSATPLNEESQKKSIKTHDLLTVFSLLKNTRRLFDTTSKPTDIQCLHGMRFLSILWIILGHSLLLLLNSISNPLSIFQYVYNHWEFEAVLNATFSVDTFFFLSGLLMAYLTMAHLVKSEGKLSVLKLYLHRYMRLTPAYAFIIYISVTLWPKLGEGPLWPSVAHSQIDLCSKYWYTNLLYINNLYPAAVADSCYAVSWYLANDFQFYLLAPIFLFALYKSPRVGMSLLVSVLVVSMALTGGFTVYTKQQPQAEMFGLISAFVHNGASTTNLTLKSVGAPTGDPYISDVYGKPWCRIGSYLIGMMTGYILHVKNNKIVIPKVLVAVGWFVSTGVVCSIIYCLYPSFSIHHPLSYSTAAFYNAMSRPVWCLCMAWITIACVSGYGGPVNSILSWKGFVPLSRLTYCCYLLHPLVIWWLTATGDKLFFFNMQLLVSVFFSTSVLTVMAAYVVYVLVELPVMELMKIFLGNGKGEISRRARHTGPTVDNTALLVGNEYVE